MTEHTKDVATAANGAEPVQPLNRWICSGCFSAGHVGATPLLLIRSTSTYLIYILPTASVNSQRLGKGCHDSRSLGNESSPCCVSGSRCSLETLIPQSTTRCLPTFLPNPIPHTCSWFAHQSSAPFNRLTSTRVESWPNSSAPARPPARHHVGSQFKTGKIITSVFKHKPQISSIFN